MECCNRDQPHWHIYLLPRRFGTATTAGKLIKHFGFAAYNPWMQENGGVIINIIADMWKGFPLMRLLINLVTF
jgi:hypothetical protein